MGIGDDRGTGRTWRQMKALPDGAIFIVAHRGNRRHCRDMLSKMGRKHAALNLVILADAQVAMQALSAGQEWDIDHHAIEVATAEQIELLAPYHTRLTGGDGIRFWIEEMGIVSADAWRALVKLKRLYAAENHDLSGPIPTCNCPQIVGRDMSVLDVTRAPCPLHPSRYL